MALTGFDAEEIERMMAWTPEEHPTIGTGAVSEAEVLKEAQRLTGELTGKDPAKVEFICPHCGEPFAVNKDDIE
jgi:hypothetical protein